VSSNREDAPIESDLTQACREMIAQLARRAKERRSRAATDAGRIHRAEEQETDDP
jgi:hypothetical protein